MTKGLFVVLMLAAITRLGGLGLIEFKADEALTVLSLQQFWKQPYLIEAGLVASTGVQNLPLLLYLLLTPAAVSTDPRWLSAVIALINAVMIGWFYGATKREFGTNVAVIAGLLLAVAPYQILFSRKIWAQDLMLLFAVPLYDLLLRKKPAYFWLGLLLMLQAQLHGSGVFFLSVICVWLGIKKQLNLKLAGGMVVGMMPALPYILSGAFSLPQSNYSVDWGHLLLPFRLLGAFLWGEVMGVSDFERFAAASPAVGMEIMAGILTAMGIGVGAWKNKKIAGLSGGLVLVYLGLGVPARLHYYQVVVPYVAVLAALGLVQLFKTQKLFLYPSVGIIVIGGVLFWGMFLRHVLVFGGVSGDYGIPYQLTVLGVDEATAKYKQRNDIQAIRAWAHFDPVLARETNGAMQHFNLARYFWSIGEMDLAGKELDQAASLDGRFSQSAVPGKENGADEAADDQ